ncbi:YrrC family ATP-dependent DNA helicase [Fructobacillus fructosus]|uniref:YrrC family ATP-dependent DNA helicase n=1 Tax=Fructobacillus fructosus TaxID=1631 RepID=UPI000309D87F|nr:hypothetical protein [Fructobacillus fructosus]
MARTISEDNQVKGVLQNVIFAAKDSYFKILSVQVESDDFDWDEDELIVTGTFASVKPGSTYAFFWSTSDPSPLRPTVSGCSL